jgi:hypothetical protein
LQRLPGTVSSNDENTAGWELRYGGKVIAEGVLPPGCPRTTVGLPEFVSHAEKRALSLVVRPHFDGNVEGILRRSRPRVTRAESVAREAWPAVRAVAEARLRGLDGLAEVRAAESAAGRGEESARKQIGVFEDVYKLLARRERRRFASGGSVRGAVGAGR